MLRPDGSFVGLPGLSGVHGMFTILRRGSRLRISLGSPTEPSVVLAITTQKTNVIQHVILHVPMGPVPPLSHVPVTLATVEHIVKRRDVLVEGGVMDAIWNALVKMGGNVIQLMEHVTVQQDLMEPYAKTNV